VLHFFKMKFSLAVFSETILIFVLKTSIKEVDVNVMPYNLVPIYPITHGHDTRHSNI